MKKYIVTLANMPQNQIACINNHIALNKKIAIDSLFSVGETITNSPLVIGENVISDKRILDSFNEFMNSDKVSGILIIEEI